MSAGTLARDVKTISPALERPPKPSFRRDIQGLRALAVLVVVLYHAGLGLPGGFIGVDMFFVISGYVISRLILWEVQSTGTLDLKSFYLRRARRIMPALALMVIVVSILGRWLAPMSGRSESTATALGATLVNANNYLAGLFTSIPGDYFSRRTELNPFLHTWSLSVEEQFYIVFPLVVAGVAAVAVRSRRGSTSSWLFFSMLLVFVVSLVASIYALRTDPTLAFYLSPLRAWEFAAGALLVVFDGRRASRAIATTLVGAGSVVFLGLLFVLNEGSNFPGLLAVLPVGATALMVVGGSANQNVLSNMLGRPSLVFVGGISYSWYLWHWPLIVFARASQPNSPLLLALALIGSLGVAWLSTRLFEDRIRFAVKSPRQTVFLGIALVLTSMTAVLVDVPTGLTVAAETTSTFDTTFQIHDATTANCRRLENPNGDCVWRVDEPVGHALLLGDSNAHHFIEGAATGLNAEGYDLTLGFTHSCALLDGLRPLVEIPKREGQAGWACDQLMDSVEADAASQDFDLIIFAISTEIYAERDLYSFAEVNGEGLESQSDRNSALTTLLAETLGDLGQGDTRVVLVESIPKFPGWFPGDCSMLTFATAEGDCGASLSRSDADAIMVDARIIERAAAEAADVESIRFDDELCTPTSCSALTDGEWRWLDYGHITVAQSEAFAPHFAALVAP